MQHNITIHYYSSSSFSLIGQRGIEGQKLLSKESARFSCGLFKAVDIDDITVIIS